MAKLMAFYLPQFHEIPENNEWWGKGFTEWVNVKNAVSLFEGHNQPKIPIEKGYYDLSNVDIMKWQVRLAKENGLYGFCFYHYFFSDRPLLEKPLLNWLNCETIDFPYCFCWANESWTNGWAREESSVIMEQTYGDKNLWKKHFNFLLPFFKDSRYIKEDNKPLVVIYRPYLCNCFIEMMDYWKKLAIENGFSGLMVASQRFEEKEINVYKKEYNYCDYHIEYQPSHAMRQLKKKPSKSNLLREKIHDFILEKFNKDLSFRMRKNGPLKVDYDETWQKIINTDPIDDKAVAGAFVSWDNTPRHKRRGSVFINVSPGKFEKYLHLQIKHVENSYKSDYIFIFAWNEWGEGGYLEPDSEYQYSYLEALRNAAKS